MKLKTNSIEPKIIIVDTDIRNNQCIVLLKILYLDEKKCKVIIFDNIKAAINCIPNLCIGENPMYVLIESGGYGLAVSDGITERIEKHGIKVVSYMIQSFYPTSEIKQINKEFREKSGYNIFYEG